MVLALAAKSNKWANFLSCFAWGFDLRLAIFVVFVVANAACGCSAQGIPPDQSFSAAPRQSYSSIPSESKVEVASWYGPGFTGHSTSTGETFNSNELTAASKTLPIGSRVRVTNPENGRSVVVRINDRGPFVRGRSLDLSHRAAREIGLTTKGVGPVHVCAAGVTVTRCANTRAGARVVGTCRFCIQ
jgi:Lytic transglycolase